MECFLKIGYPMGRNTSVAAELNAVAQGFKALRLLLSSRVLPNDVFIGEGVPQQGEHSYLGAPWILSL